MFCPTGVLCQSDIHLCETIAKLYQCQQDILHNPPLGT